MYNFFSPLEQFSILEQFSVFIRIKIIGLTLFLDTSISLFLIENINNFFFVLSSLFLFTFFLNKNLSVNNSVFLILYNFLFSILNQQVKEKKFLNKYFILIVSIFLFILINNILGMIPYSFVSTAQLGQNFFLSSSLVIFFSIINVKIASLIFLLKVFSSVKNTFFTSC